MIQLSLFPRRGFAIVLPNDVIAVDHSRGELAVYATKLEAMVERRDGMAKWLRPLARVARVEIHDDVVFIAEVA